MQLRCQKAIRAADRARRSRCPPVSAENLGVLSASLRSGTGSEAVALRHPVMPIANGLGCGFVGIDGSQLR